MALLSAALAMGLVVTPALDTQARNLCAAIAGHVDQIGGTGPLFLRSYEPGQGEAELPAPLATSAFAYDNALAIIALATCGDTRRAARIGDAFVDAVAHDRTFGDGRVRNAYRAGPVEPGPAKLPGWWDKKQSLWAEDAYQDGTQTGNVAWVGLALLRLDQVMGSQRYRPTAERLGTWILKNANDDRAPGGFAGGVDGYDQKQVGLAWRSTEHNVDVQAFGTWLVRAGSPDLGHRLATPARRFLDAMFDSTAGMFRLGTKPDGSTQPVSKLALDALTWPIVGVADAPASWRQSLSFARSKLSVAGGYDFNDDRDGLWTEGTAQMAFVEGYAGDVRRREDLLSTLEGLAAPSGYLYATRTGRITTGIAIGPTSDGEDFFYFHRPHLGATAWAILAATRTNPFAGPESR